MVQEAVAKREEQLRTAFKTDTLEGRVGELTKSIDKIGATVDSNHVSTLKKLEEVNHVKRYVDERLDKTDAKIDTLGAQQTALMSAHLISPHHALMSAHIAQVADLEGVMLSIPHKELGHLPGMVHREAVQEENRAQSNVFQKTLELKFTSLYAILGATSVLASGVLWIATHLTIH